MFECADWNRIKLDLLKGIPRAYSSLLTRLSQDGLSEVDVMDDAKFTRLSGILDDYYNQFVLHA
ncbi:MAG: hypothetical protein H7839_07895 [Magnetococcus sp. YQC-5]